MDFFQSQDDARRNTKVLLFFFSAAVISIVMLTNLLILAVANYSNTYTVATGEFRYGWPMILAVSAGVLLFILLGSLFRILSLSKGGEAVAGLLDGELLLESGGNIQRRRLLNVVEEMAIASGTPVPPVYLIPDASINAFAAGFSPGDAVIGITEGAVENLDRDQLQGVVAHEFSHILNGDMRLNIRLMGMLYGILMLAVIGRILLRGSGRSSSSSRRGSGGAIVALGLGLFVLGYVGRFFGNLIKAAVSRQREFLADASAVQFTRNPDGIGGALRRIGGYESGSVLHNANSEELSHAFFSQGVKYAFSSLMATHPPLDERIRRIDPRWDGTYIERTQVDTTPEEGPAAMVSGFAGQAGRIDADAAIGVIGNPGTSQLAHARNLIAAMPDGLAAAARETWSARAIAYLVLLDGDPSVRKNQIEHLESSADALVYSRLHELLDYVDDITAEMRLPLLEMALPSLRQLTEEQYRAFKANIAALIEADKRIGLGEWALQKFVTKHLGEAFEGKHTKAKHTTLEKVKGHCAMLLSVLAYADRGARIRPEEAFAKGREALELDIQLLGKDQVNLRRLNEAVDTLANLRPLRKPKLLKACIATITADQVVAPVEAELVRAISDSLDCPMPPIKQ